MILAIIFPIYLAKYEPSILFLIFLKTIFYFIFFHVGSKMWWEKKRIEVWLWKKWRDWELEIRKEVMGARLMVKTVGWWWEGYLKDEWERCGSVGCEVFQRWRRCGFSGLEFPQGWMRSGFNGCKVFGRWKGLEMGSMAERCLEGGRDVGWWGKVDWREKVRRKEA